MVLNARQGSSVIQREHYQLLSVLPQNYGTRLSTKDIIDWDLVLTCRKKKM